MFLDMVKKDKPKASFFFSISAQLLDSADGKYSEKILRITGEFDNWCAWLVV